MADAGPADTATAADLREQGLDPYDPDLAPTLAPRSTRQRLHDALSTGLARILGADLLGLTHDKQPVQMVVAIGADTLDGAPGALPGRTGSGVSVSGSLARRWACGSALTRHVLGLTGRLLGDSHTGRTLTRRERRALHSQNGGRCQGAGCSGSTHHPGTVLHPHHADPWARCGTTSLADAVHLCDRCHAHVHHGHQPAAQERAAARAGRLDGGAAGVR